MPAKHFKGGIVLPNHSSSLPSGEVAELRALAGTPHYHNGSVWVPITSIPTVPVPVTSLPGSPINGQIATFDPSAWVISGTAEVMADVEWLLQYRSSTSKWHFLGGPPLVVKVDTQQSRNANSYADLTTVGPGVTIPIAGDYMFQVGAMGFPGASASTQGIMSYAVGGTAAQDADGVRIDSSVNTIADQNISAPRRKTVAAATNVLSKYKVFTANTMNFLYRWISVQPVRMG